VPALCIASTKLRALSAHTVVGARPLRVPMVEMTASLSVTASTIVAGSMTSATTTSRPARSGASRVASRTTARIWLPPARPCSTTCEPVRPVAPNTVNFIGYLRCPEGGSNHRRDESTPTRATQPHRRPPPQRRAASGATAGAHVEHLSAYAPSGRPQVRVLSRAPRKCWGCVCSTVRGVTARAAQVILTGVSGSAGSCVARRTRASTRPWRTGVGS
jgi:hypothetical protein